MFKWLFGGYETNKEEEEVDTQTIRGYVQVSKTICPYMGCVSYKSRSLVSEYNGIFISITTDWAEITKEQYDSFLFVYGGEITKKVDLLSFSFKEVESDV